MTGSDEVPAPHRLSILTHRRLSGLVAPLNGEVIIAAPLAGVARGRRRLAVPTRRAAPTLHRRHGIHPTEEDTDRHPTQVAGRRNVDTLLRLRPTGRRTLACSSFRSVAKEDRDVVVDWTSRSKTDLHCVVFRVARCGGFAADFSTLSSDED